MTEPSSPVFIYDTVDGDLHTYYVSPLPYQDGFAMGLPTEAIMGTLKDGPESVVPESFIPNKLFSRFLAFVIAKYANDCPGLVAEAQRQQDGFVYILDKRTKTPDGHVPPEDIIGGFEIDKGKLLRFHASPNHQMLTQDGFMQLEQFLNSRLIEELIEISRSNSDQGAE